MGCLVCLFVFSEGAVSALRPISPADSLVVYFKSSEKKIKKKWKNHLKSIIILGVPIFWAGGKAIEMNVTYPGLRTKYGIRCFDLNND